MNQDMHVYMCRLTLPLLPSSFFPFTGQQHQSARDRDEGLRVIVCVCVCACVRDMYIGLKKKEVSRCYIYI